jgi:hypothetical protein
VAVDHLKLGFALETQDERVPSTAG